MSPLGTDYEERVAVHTRASSFDPIHMPHMPPLRHNVCCRGMGDGRVGGGEDGNQRLAAIATNKYVLFYVACTKCMAWYTTFSKLFGPSHLYDDQRLAAEGEAALVKPRRFVSIFRDPYLLDLGPF